MSEKRRTHTKTCLLNYPILSTDEYFLCAYRSDNLFAVRFLLVLFSTCLPYYSLLATTPSRPPLHTFLSALALSLIRYACLLRLSPLLCTRSLSRVKGRCARGLEDGNRYTEPKQQRPKQQRLRLALLHVCSLCASLQVFPSPPPPLLSSPLLSLPLSFSLGLSLALNLAQPNPPSTAWPRFLATVPPLFPPSVPVWLPASLPTSLLASSQESSERSRVSRASGIIGFLMPGSSKCLEARPGVVDQ